MTKTNKPIYDKTVFKRALENGTIRIMKKAYMKAPVTSLGFRFAGDDSMAAVINNEEVGEILLYVGERKDIEPLLTVDGIDMIAEQVVKHFEALEPHFQDIVLVYMGLKEYQVPVSYEMCGHVTVWGRFDKLDDARKLAQAHINDFPLPKDAEYLEDSFAVDVDGVVKIGGKYTKPDEEKGKEDEE